jgi:N-acetylglutamate synthase-like GNAT family acetyltransferase
LKDFEIMICERQEYNLFLDMANIAFGHDAPSEWMQKNMPLCTPYERDATDDEIAKHYIAMQDGAVIGAVGAYPFDWMVAENKEASAQFLRKAFGIGQVCCEQKNRGRGVMRTLLERAITDMTNAGAVLGFLSGDRFRYSHFGFDFGGANAVFEFSQARLSQRTTVEGMRVHKATHEDIPVLNEMYEKLPSRLLRSENTWDKHLRSLPRVWLLAEQDQKKAFACFQTARGIVEAQGDPELLKQLILWILREWELEKAEVYYPHAAYLNDSVYQMLYEQASWMHVQPLSLIATDLPRLRQQLSFEAAPPLRLEPITPLVVWLSEADNI